MTDDPKPPTEAPEPPPQPEAGAAHGSATEVPNISTTDIVDSPSTKTPRSMAAVAGLLAAGVALGTGELLSSLSSRIPSLITRVGDVVINNVPGSIERWAIDTLGTNDKPALIIGITVISLIIGAATGVAAAKNFGTAWVVFGLFALLGALAAGSDPQRGAGWGWFAALVSAVAGVATLAFLVRAAGDPRSEFIGPNSSVSQAFRTTEDHRRRFMGAAGAVLAVGVTAPLVANSLRGRRSQQVEANRDRAASAIDDIGADPTAIPEPLDDPSQGGGLSGEGAEASRTGDPAAAPTVQPEIDISQLDNFDDIEGMTPVIVKNDEYYRIDTALVVPELDIETWSMKVTGMVDTELELTFDDLLELDPVEEFVTLSCVSNEVGGDLVGNARWLGVPITKLLTMAGVQPGATQIVGRSVDGWTGGFPTEYLDDPDRVALVAIAMNGEPLPLEHGFPVRLVVAGLYGYVSATKWLKEIELTTWQGFDGYWVPRGWSKLGPVKTQSRIDVPRPNSTIPTGGQAVAGVAWAPDRGIAKVEVQFAAIVDGQPDLAAPWVETQLSADIGNNAWRQWYHEWQAPAGDHVIRVRATDNDGYTQTEQRAPVAPNGATGWHGIVVRAQ